MICKKSFGRLGDGREAHLYTIGHENGLSASFTDYGASVVSIMVPDKSGKFYDVALGCDCAGDYEKQTACLGGVPGRFANRIENGRFVLNGKEYLLEVNNGPNHLHGGSNGFHRRLWNAGIQDDRVVFTRLSPEGEGGYPGNLVVSVSYGFTEQGKLTIDFAALSDADTILNLTNHTYFNLNGQGSGKVLRHRLKIFSQFFTENDGNCLPTGRVISLDEEEGSPFDFREFHPIGERIGADNQQLRNGSGYDHNYILAPNKENIAAEAVGELTGIHLVCRTTQPGLQLYTGNFLSEGNILGKRGGRYQNQEGFCLEAQHFPASPSHPQFPNVVLRAGERFCQQTTYEFLTV